MEPTHYNRAMAHLRAGEYQEAVDAFTEAIAFEPDAPNGYVGRALAFRSLGNEEQARADEQAAQVLGGAEQTEWQRLANRAYQRLKTDLSNATQGEFYQRLDPLQRNAVLLWDFTTQVFNGGCRQWAANGYAEWIDEFIAAVDEIGTDSAKGVSATLQQLRGILLDSAATDDDVLERLYGCDNAYFHHQMQFCEDVEAWIERQSPR